MTTVYLAGSEDTEFAQLGGGVVVTTNTRYRTAFSRSALSSTMLNSGAGLAGYWRNTVPFSASTFWFGAQIASSATGGFNTGASYQFLEFCTSDALPRIRFRGTSSSSFIMAAYKVDAAGTATQLGSSFAFPLTVTTGGMTKLDINIVYAVAGSINVYMNGVLLFSFTGDVTTNSTTTLAYVNLQNGSQASAGVMYWSEIMVLDIDTRSLNLQGFDPVANGNTHNFDTGTPAAANVNEATLDITTLDGSTTAGQIDQYTTGAVAAGTFGVLAYGVSAALQKGTSGPGKADLGVRTGSTDYWSADQTLITSFGLFQNWWTVNPNTGVAWLPSQIGSTTGFNIGIKSVT